MVLTPSLKFKELSASRAHFVPGSTRTRVANTESARLEFPDKPAAGVWIVNAGSVLAYFDMGDSTVTATTASIPIEAGKRLLVERSIAQTHIAFITASGVSTIHTSLAYAGRGGNLSLLTYTPVEDLIMAQSPSFYADGESVLIDSNRRIAALYDISGNNRHFTQATDGYKPLLSQPDMAPVGPIVHFKCEDNAASTVVVNSGTSGTNGTAARNTDTWSTASGKIGRGFDFYNGSTADKIDLGSDVIASGSEATFCAWIKADSNGGYLNGRILTSDDDVVKIVFNGMGQVVIFGPAGTRSDVWAPGEMHHYAFIRSGISALVYKDGVLFDQAVHPALTGAVGRYIGNRSDHARYFDGIMDDIRIYDYALTPAQIAAIYNGGNGTHNASAGINGHRTLVFDGVDDVLARTDFIGTGADTIFVVSQPYSFGGANAGRLLDNGKTIHSLNSTNSLVDFTSDGSTTAKTANDSVTLNSVAVHAVTRTAAGAANHYINGLLSGTADQASGTPEAASTDLCLGNRAARDRGFHGPIAAVIAFPKVLTADQVYAISLGLRRKYGV